MLSCAKHFIIRHSSHQGPVLAMHPIMHTLECVVLGCCMHSVQKWFPAIGS